MKKIYILLVSLIFINQQEIFSQGPWTFSSSNDVWESSGTAANLTTSATYSILEVNGAGNPQLRSYQASIDANIKNTAVIKLKNNTSNTVMRVFYNDGASLSDFSDVGSGWKYTNVTISANDTEIKTYYVKLDSNAAWTGTINNMTIQFREDSNYNSALDDGLGNIFIYDVSLTKYKWTFDAASSDWSRDNATNLVYNGTNATLTLKTDNTGYNGIKTTVGIVGEDYNYLVVRIQNSSDRSKLRVRFDKDDSDYGYKTIDISTNDTGFKTYYVNMGSLTTWDTSGIKDDVTIQIGTNTTNPGTTIFDDVRFLSSSKDINQLTFDGDADYQTLSAANGSSIANNDGYATWTLDGNNNNAKLEMKTSGFYYTTDADMNKLVTVELVNVSANDQLAFVSTASGQEFTPISMNPNDTDDPNGTAQSIIFNITKDGWSGATNNSWFLRARNSSNSNAVEAGKIYIKSITFSDNTTPIETIADGDWANGATWYGGVVPSFKQTVKINHNVSASSYFNMRSMTIDSGKSFITTSTFSGDVTYNRNLATANWYLVSSPVAGEDMTDMRTNNSFANGTGGSRIGFAKYESDSWSYFTSSSSDVLVSGTGYSTKLASTGDISFTGTLNTTDVETPSLATGFNLIGNPFTSYINSATFLGAATSSNLDQTQIWLWNQGSNGGSGMYEVKTAAGAEPWILPPGQGFFVKAISDGTVTFAESNQLNTGSTFQKTSKTDLKLLMNDGTNYRFFKIYYRDNASKGFDYGFEGETFGGIPNSLSVFTHLLEDNQGKNYQVQSLPNKDYESMVIPVGVIAAADKELTFTAEAMNLPADLKVFLEDRENGVITRLDEQNNNYKVALNEDLNGTGRFYLHTSNSALSADDIALTGVRVFAPNKNTLRVSGINSANGSVKIFSILGKKVLEKSFSSKGVSDINLPNLNTGVYIIQLNTEAGKLNKKIILE
ncbi:MAG: T9SS type A sorting domain-containing protein [Polaribacter sp.]|nr:T9SS type A sorting domain-containing protein [Polaribacter sp.]